MNIDRKQKLETIITELIQRKPKIGKMSLDSFLVCTMKLLDDGKITLDDIHYLVDAYYMPYEDMKKHIDYYDENMPKIDELEFANDLSLKYKTTTENILKRIRDVRMLTQNKEKKNKEKVK